MNHNIDTIGILDFGGQYAHLIANRIRRLSVYSEIVDASTPAEELKRYKGLILSGGPASVYGEGVPDCDENIFKLGIPVLGICYGHQLMIKKLGGEVSTGRIKEYGHATIHIKKHEGIFKELENEETVWMSHGDEVSKLPEGMEIIGSTESCEFAAVADLKRNFYGVQFHPEVTHTKKGMNILDNFIEICGANRDWSLDIFIEHEIGAIKEKVGDKKVFMLISGGVDSTVAYKLIQDAIGAENTTGLFVNTGFIRENEQQEVEKAYESAGIKNVKFFDASGPFFSSLKNIYDPEKKREIIGNQFIEVQKRVVDDLGLNSDEWILGQGTIYPDTIETGGTKHSDKIKTHHNRVEIIEEMIKEGKVIEPLHQLYKDEVRKVGSKLGIPDDIVWRHPFPGPGLAVRCLCVQKDDYPENHDEIQNKIQEFLKQYKFSGQILPIKSVGVQGDARTYKHPFALQLYKDTPRDWKLLNELSTEITNRFPEINRVLLKLFPKAILNIKTKPGYLTQERIELLQKTDYRVTQFIKYHKMYNEIWQFPTVLLPLSINNKDGECIVLRPINSQEAMTANFYEMPWKWVDELTESFRQMDGIDGAFYDLTNKPPGTIEWE